MVKNKTIKLEFTSYSTKSFVVNAEMYGNYIECYGKAAGKLNNDYFLAKYSFIIDVKTSELTFLEIHDIEHVGNSSSDDTEDLETHTINPTFKKNVYNFLYYILSVASVQKSEISLIITITNNFSNTTVDYFVLHIDILNSAPIDNSESSESNSSSKYINKIDTSDTLDTSNKKDTVLSSSHKSSFNSSNSLSSSFTDSSKKKIIYEENKIFHKKVLKLVSWSAVICFILYILKNKITDSSKKKLKNAKLNSKDLIT